MKDLDSGSPRAWEAAWEHWKYGVLNPDCSSFKSGWDAAISECDRIVTAEIKDKYSDFSTVETAKEILKDIRKMYEQEVE